MNSGPGAMKAAWYDRKGPARSVLKVGELALEEPGPGEVRVRLFASGVNPTDCKRRAGQGADDPGYSAHFPDFERIVPHSDGSGTIDAVGADVDDTRIGERVWVFDARYRRPFGTAAQFAVLAENRVVSLPQGVTFAEGACLGIPAMTAHRCVYSDGPIDGQLILVTGGAGAVGNYAVQLAKWGGARVLTTVSSDEKEKRAKQAGADCVINYKKDDIVTAVMDATADKGVDRIVDVNFGAHAAIHAELMASNGTVASYASTDNRTPEIPFYPLMLSNATLRLVMVHAIPEEAKTQAVEDISLALKDGFLSHYIGSRFPLDRIVDAHEALESGTVVGNVVIDIE